MSSKDLYSLDWKDVTVNKGGNIAIGDKSSVEHLKTIIESMESDETVRDIVKEIESFNIQLRNNTELQRFNLLREEIVKQVLYRQKALDGKCDYCPNY